MSSIKIHAGDFQLINILEPIFGAAKLHCFSVDGAFWGEKLPLTELAEVTVASEESVKKLGGTVGWGAVGGALLGPVGLLAGLLLGGKKTEVTFVAVLKDGRKFLGTASSKDFTKLKAAVFV